MNTIRRLLLSLLCSVLASPVLAMWAYIPREIRLLEADAVVIGTIEKLAEGFAVDNRPHDVGVLTVRQVLKGPATLKEVRLAWPQRPKGNLFIADGPLHYAVGQQGLWILRRDAVRGVYQADYPGDFQQVANQEEVAAKLKPLAQIEWSPAKDGMQFALWAEQRTMRGATVQINGKPVVALAQASIYVLARNAGKELAHLANHFPDRPMSLDYTGPDGKPIEVKLYGDPQPNPPPPQKHSFVALAPGAVRNIGYGFGLPPITKPGAYTVKVKYTNQRDGQSLALAGVWRGTVAVPARKFNVQAVPTP